MEQEKIEKLINHLNNIEVEVYGRTKLQDYFKFSGENDLICFKNKPSVIFGEIERSFKNTKITDHYTASKYLNAITIEKALRLARYKGYKIKELDSVLLANLIYQYILNNRFLSICNQIENCINNHYK